VRQADVLLVNGGDALYLCHWMRQSGLADLLKSLPDIVWVGLSAGSMVMTPRVGEAFVEAKPPITGDDRALGIVDFSIFPHLDHPGFDENTMACAEEWAANIGCPAYAIDDQSAIVVVGGSARWSRKDDGGSSAIREAARLGHLRAESALIPPSRAPCHSCCGLTPTTARRQFACAADGRRCATWPRRGGVQGPRRVRLALACLALLQATAAHAHVYGIDRRVQRDADVLPYRAVGMLVDPRTAMAARLPRRALPRRQCAPRTVRRRGAARSGETAWPRRSVRFLVGPQPGKARVFASSTIATVVDAGRFTQDDFAGAAGDWAILRLDDCLGDRYGWLRVDRDTTPEDLPGPR
jgi:hypothetical protein